MGYRGQELPIINDFSGGQNSVSPPSNIGFKQAVDFRNCVVLPKGQGFRKRQGNTTFNSSAMVSGTTPVTGLAYYKQADGDEWLMATAGTKLFKSDSLDGTMDDITGTLTLTNGQNNFWQMFTFEDTLIGVGGAPDAPFKWTGAGNGALLGGTPPNGRFGFQHNNRVFIGNTTTNPSRIQWSVLGDAEDWSGTGSGFQDVWTSDNDTLVGAAIMSTDIVFLFKQNSIHQMITRIAPFPVFPLFQGIGAVSKNSIVVVDGIVYFITSRGRMAITDGNRILNVRDIPNLRDIDNIWEGLNSSSRNLYSSGIYYRGKDFRHIYWFVSNGSSTTNNLAIVWDVDNQCWIRYDSGYSMNVATKTQEGVMYAGAYDGKIYQVDVNAIYSDASEGTTSINGIWKSGWENLGSLQKIKQIDWLNIDLETQSAGNLNVRIGADYNENLLNKSVNMQASGGKWDQMIWDQDVWGTQEDIITNVIDESVRGNTLQIGFDNNVLNETFKINGFNLSGKISGQKEITSN